MSDPAGDPLADAIDAAVRRGTQQQHAFDNPPPGHVHGPDCHPVHEVVLVLPQEPVLIAAIVEDPDSPTGHSARILGAMSAELIPATLRAIADQFELTYRAGLS